ncbi:MAG: hypothetical protein ACI9OJ_002103 [Myxococcota bacterium]
MATQLAVALATGHQPADEAVASAETLLVKHLAGILEFELQSTLPIDLAQTPGR